MVKSFDSLPDSSRVWVYQADRNLSDNECQTIINKVNNFIDQWDTHGTPLVGSCKVFFNRFIVLAVDQEQQAPSGCSIDKSVDVIRILEKELNVNLFGRMEVAFLDGDILKTIHTTKIKEAITEGSLISTSEVFDNTVQALGEFKEKWKTEIKNTWLNRYFDKVAIK